MIKHLPPRARAFAAAVIAAGALTLAASLYELVSGAGSAPWLVVTALAVVTGTCMIKLPRIEMRFSPSSALLFAALLLLGPACATMVAAVDAVAASLRFNKRDQLYAFRMLFNMTAAALSIWVPGHLFLSLGGHTTSAAPLGLQEGALPLAALVAGYSVLNTGLIGTVIALTSRTPVRAIWRDNFTWIWIAHAWSGLVAGAIAIFIPHVNLSSSFVILTVGAVAYATVRVYLRKVEESTGRLHKLNGLYLSTIKALAMAIDAKDQVTHGHIRRVQVYAVGLAQALGITDELTVKGIEAGALLHDTGKIAVPEHILNKPGKLNAQEYERMKTHVTIGAEILSGIEFPFPVIPYVRHHHENWDGTGYPDRLAGEAIPLGARILSVVDCFDALTSDRPYRRALTTEAALDILRERAGTMYDPAVVAKFIEIYPELTAMLAGDPASSAGDPAELPAEAARTPDEGGTVDAELDDVPRLVGSGLSADEAAFLLTNRLKRRLRFTSAAVYAPRAADDRLEPLHVSGRHADLFRHTQMHLGQGLSGWVAANGQFIVNASPALDLLGPVARCEVQLSSALVVPFAAPSGAKGALALYSDTPDAFTLDDARLAGEAAIRLSRALRVALQPDAPTAKTQAA